MTVCVYSGGLDSTVLLTTLLADRSGDVLALSVDYGQRHRVELEHAALVCQTLGVKHQVADLTAITGLIGGSSLTSDDVPVPDGHYAEESMRATVVPNRNAIMISLAGGVAVAAGHSTVAVGVHSGDHHIYPDCRPSFIRRMGEALKAGTEGFGNISLRAPFLLKTKSDIVTIGAQVGAPMHLSWSCYKGGDVHCGTCGTCVERREAFALADVPDLTTYAS